MAKAQAQPRGRTGTRCAVCVGCGRCFETVPGEGEATSAQATGWSGERCAVCVGCGKCAKAWGLASKGEGVDAVSGATDWAAAFKALDAGAAGAPPALAAPPGATAVGAQPTSSVAAAAASAEEAVVGLDAVTGATPGVATACKELDLGAKVASLGLKPPGVA